MPEALARDSFLARQGQEAHELLAFVTNGELYAVQLAAVQEIVVPPPLTFVPRAPRAVVGVCSVRGRLVTVVDFRACLGLPGAPLSRKSRILLALGDEDEVLGLRVDEVRHVVRLAPSELELTTQNLGGDLADAVRGIGRPADGGELVLIDLHVVLKRGAS